MEQAIGLFDSGVGGLTVLNTIQTMLPNENIIYVGDNINCPYGNKTKEQLFTYASRIVEYFIDRNVKLIVLACNTTSANVLVDLQATYPDVEIVGVIDATVEDYKQRNVNKTLVIATQGTIQSNQYAKSMKACNLDASVYSLVTEKLVPLVESGMYKEGIYEVLHEYLDEYVGKIDSIILGCTHYPILKNQIQRVLPNIEYISSSQAIGSQVERYLTQTNTNNTKKREYVEIYTTGEVEEFIYSSSGFFDYTKLEVKHLQLSK